VRIKGGMLVTLLTAALFVSGCATTTQDQTMVTRLQMRVGELERQLDSKDQRITELEYNLKDLSYNINRVKEQPRAAAPVTRPAADLAAGDGEIIRVNASVADVQQALKNAGYYNGTVDGKLGPMTRQSIMKFQESKNLKADGIIGRQTWELLRTFAGR
jgi:peptidoglycan hydrolase-like protein with peptidoglycan-binding domain